MTSISFNINSNGTTRAFTITDPGLSANVLLDQGSQIINGAKIFGSTITAPELYNTGSLTIATGAGAITITSGSSDISFSNAYLTNILSLAAGTIQPTVANGTIYINAGTGTVNLESNTFINNSSNYTWPPTSTLVPSCVVYGSGTTDVSDVFHVRENTNTNPREIYMGYNTTGGYGVIQSVYSGFTYTETRINPSGGITTACNGFKMLNGGLSGYSPTTIQCYTEVSLATNFTWGGIGMGPYSVKLTRIGRVVFVHVPNIVLSGAAQSSTIVSSVTIPAPFQPVDATAVGVGGNVLLANGNWYATRNIIDIGTMLLYIEFAGGSSSAIASTSVQIDPYTITYSV